MKIKFNLKRFFIYFLILTIIFLIDRTSKIYIINLAEGNTILDIYLNKFINIFLIWNKGIGFGLLSFDNNKFYNFITILIVLINLLILYFVFKSQAPQSWFFLVTLGGSLGNLYDRIYYSAVPDFIDLNYNGYHWFIFNVADIFITTGIICLICTEVLQYKKNNEK